MINLYLFKLTNNVFTHLLAHCFVLGRQDLHDPCTPIIKNNLLDWNMGKFVTEIESRTLLRQISWGDYISQLDWLVDNNLVRQMSTYRDDQVVFLQNYLKDKVQIINVTYSKQEYDFMLEFFVKVHIHKQNIGILPVNEHDQHLRDQKIDLVSHYKQAFDQANLIPHSIPNIQGFNVPVADFFQQDAFLKQIEAIGGNDTPAVRDFYQTWQEISKQNFSWR